MAGLVAGYPRGSSHRMFVSAARAKLCACKAFAAGRLSVREASQALDSRDKLGHDAEA